MKRLVVNSGLVGLCSLVVGSLVVATLGIVASNDRRASGGRSAGQASEVMSRVPLAFEPGPQAGTFAGRGAGFSVSFTPDGASIRTGETGVLMRAVTGSSVAPVGGGATQGRVSYFSGDPRSSGAGLTRYEAVEYRAVWPGVDLVFHGAGSLGGAQALEHDFVVAPGADPSVVAVEFVGARGVRLGTGGDLLVGAGAGGTVRFARPRLFQDVAGTRRPVTGGFSLLGGTRIGFSVGSYDRNQALVIDPVLVTSTYFGGGGTDVVNAVATDAAGAVYVVGSTDSIDFRLTPGASQSRLNLDGPRGPTDAFVAKIDPSGDKLVWSTYLGGASRDSGLDVAVATDGSVVVAGVTESPDFPHPGTPAQADYGGGTSDAFVAHLDPNGAALTYSTFLGGNGLDGARGIAIDANGAAYVVGSTSSPDFPSVNPLRNARKGTDPDAFVTKVNASGSKFIYSTRVGGTSDDHGLDIALSVSGAATIAGDTRSPNFPTAKPLQAAIGGGAAAGDANSSDAFVARLDPAGATLEYSTFLGGAGSDQATGVAVDAEGATFLSGNTSSADFPLAAALQPAMGGDTDAFVSKLDGPGSALVYSTYLGGSGADGANGVVVDTESRAQVVGVTSSPNFATREPVQAANAGGASDGFLATVDAAGSALVVSTYLGGANEDQALAVVLVGSDPVVVGSSASTNLPTERALQPASATGPSDGFVTRVSLTGKAPAAAGPDARLPVKSSSSGTTGHERRVQVLVGLTALLFLAAVAQTAYLRRRNGPGAGIFDSPSGAAGGIGRIDDDDRWNSVAILPPDDGDANWPDPHAPAPVSQEDLTDVSFWDMFPDEMPPHGRVPGDEEWWTDDLPAEDLLSRRSEKPPPPPPTAPPRRRNVPTSGPGDADVLLTELLAGELSSPPSSTRTGEAGVDELNPSGEGDDRSNDNDNDNEVDEGESDGRVSGDPESGVTVRRSPGGASSRPTPNRAGAKPKNRRSGRRKRPNG